MVELLAHNHIFPRLILSAAVIYALLSLIPYTGRKLEGWWGVTLTFLFGGICVWWIGSCPVVWDSGLDRDWVAVKYEWIREWCPSIKECFRDRDVVWHLYQYLCGRMMEYRAWFYLTASIYVGAYISAAGKLNRKMVLPLFLAIVGGFGFYTYGINGVRTGLGVALITLAYSYSREFGKMGLCLIGAVCCHITMLLPAVAAMTAYGFSLRQKEINRNSKGKGKDLREVTVVFVIWLACFLFSLTLGGKMMDLCNSFISSWERFSYLNDPEFLNSKAGEYRTGFRIDFVVFSMLPMIVAAAYLLIGKYRSLLYERILMGYVLTNACWLLMIRLPFTDRIAYLSWFLMPILLFYPLLDESFKISGKKIIVGCSLIAEVFLFNYLI